MSERDADEAHLVQECLAGYVDRITAGEPVDVEEIRRSHPAHAAEIIEHLRLFLEVGLEAEAPSVTRTLGDYTLRRRIGRGGMGVVYEAWENSMDRRVALKVLPPGIAADDRAFQRFLREARTAGKLSHPNVVPVYATGIKDQTPYFAMEYVEGETLAGIVARMRATAPGAPTPFGHGREDQSFYLDVARAFADVADGLQHAHSKGVIHRDVKPSNLILEASSASRPGSGNGVGRSGATEAAGPLGSASSHDSVSAPRLRILDFGLAHLEGQESLSASGDVVGTPLYMSPEQARRRKVPIDHRTDVYSLGATLYEVLTLEPPFRGKDHEDTLSQIVSRDPRPPRQLNPRVPRDLETIVLKCLRKEPADRYGTAEALGQDLCRFVRGDPIEARPSGPWEKLARRAWRARRRLAVLAVTLLFLSILGLLIRGHLIETWRMAEVRYAELVREAVMKIHLGRWTGSSGALGALDPRAKVFQPIGTTHLQRAEILEDALRILDRAAILLPGRPESYYYRAVASGLLGRDQDARREIDRCLATDPGFLPARALSRREPPPAAIADIAESPWVASWSEARKAMAENRWKEAADAQGRLIRMEDGGREPYLGSSIESRLGRGIARLEMGDLIGALRDFEAARTLWPGALEPALLLGKTLLRMGEDGRARELFDEIHGDAADSDGAAVGIVAIHRQLGMFQEGLAWTDKIRSEFQKARSRLTLRYGMGQRDEALQEGNRALELEPRDSGLYPYISLAITLGHGYTEETERLCQRILAGDPLNVLAWMIWGDVLFRRHEIDAAVAKYEKVLEIDPRDVRALYSLAWIHLYRLETDEAVAEMREAFRLAPDDLMVRANLAEVLNATGVPGEALCLARQVIRLEPHDFQYQCLLVCTLIGNGGYPEALKVAEDCVMRFPELSDAHCLAGAAYRLLKMYPEATAAYARAKALDPRSPPGSIFGPGYIHENQGRLVEAEDCFRTAVELYREFQHSYDEPATRRDLCRVLWRLGRREDALDEGEKLLRSFPKASGIWLEHGDRLRMQARPLDAFDAYAEAIVLDWAPHRRLIALHRREEKQVDLGARWDLLVERLEAGKKGLEDPALASIAALGRIHGATRKDLGRARALVARALEKGSGDADVIATAAEVEFLDGKKREAVLTLERALRLPGADRFLENEIEEYRRAILPDLASYESVDAALGRSAPGAAGDRPLLDGFRGVAGGEDRSILLYLEGRVLQRGGDLAAAAETFSSLLQAGDRRPLIALRRGESLRGAGRLEEAEGVLREAVQSENGDLMYMRDLAYLWFSLCLDDLRRTPDDVLGGLPATDRHGEDIAWLLGRIRSGEAIRLRCGAMEEYVDSAGAAWGKDRFFLGGVPASHEMMEIAGTGDAPLYRTERWFSPQDLPRYRVPLPRGKYTVALHFAEHWCSAPGCRRFDVRIAGKTILEDFEPVARGFATAQKYEFPVNVEDGLLDIEFVAKIEYPMISGIEISRAIE